MKTYKIEFQKDISSPIETNYIFANSPEFALAEFIIRCPKCLIIGQIEMVF